MKALGVTKKEKSGGDIGKRLIKIIIDLLNKSFFIRKIGSIIALVKFEC